jgi:hypothetical protein
MTKTSRQSTGGSGAALGVGAVLLLVLCCAGPALIAGGALAAGGRLLSSPVVTVAGLAVAVGGVALVLFRRARGKGDCCEPPDRVTDPARHDQETRRH